MLYYNPILFIFVRN